jgi:hypothetical protein
MCFKCKIDIYANKLCYSLSCIKLAYHIFPYLLGIPCTHPFYSAFYIENATEKMKKRYIMSMVTTSRLEITPS